MKKCAICNKELNGGLVVDKECLEQLEASDASKEQSSIEYYNLYRELRDENAKLQAENAKLKRETNYYVQKIAVLQGDLQNRQLKIYKPKTTTPNN